VCKVIDVPAAIDALQEKIKKLIEDAKAAKEKSIEELKNAEHAVKHVGEEVKAIIDDAESTAERLGTKILEDAKKQVESIGINAKKVIEAEEKKAQSFLSQRASLASLELAKKHIKWTLGEKKHLHAKFINDSMDELDRLNF
jgi:F-type H+-transporting ATPase subunit b